VKATLSRSLIGFVVAVGLTGVLGGAAAAASAADDVATEAREPAPQGRALGRGELGAIAEFAVAPQSRPLAIVAGPDGALWFTQIGAGKIGRMSTDGVLTDEWQVPTLNSQPDGIAIGPDGSVWFAEVLGNQIGRLNPDDGKFVEYSVPTANSRPTEVAVAPDGSVWFTERGTAAAPGGKVGKVDPSSGLVTEYPVREGSRPLGIVAGPDGNMWFTESAANRIGRINLSGTLLAEYELPGPNRQPWEPTVGPDGAVWFTEALGNRIGRITTDGTLTEYEIPTAGSGPNVIVSGADPTAARDCAYQRDAAGAAFALRYGVNESGTNAFGACVSQMAQTDSLWFAETLANKIARITTTGIITEFAIPSAATQPVGVASGPDGHVWFAESAAATGNRIGRLFVR
jgi:streptogramin lyase